MPIDLKKFTDEELLDEVKQRMTVYKNDTNVSQNNTKPEFKKFDFLPNAIFDKPTSWLKTRGRYETETGNPDGIVIHFTAGRYTTIARDFFSWMKENGLATLYIEHNGQVVQNQKLNEWGYHAGSSQCPVTKRWSVSKYYIGIEVACPGRLTKINDDAFESWFGKQYKREQVRYVEGGGDYFKGGYVHSGWYAKFSNAQEESLIKTCALLCKNYDIDPKLIFSHDEVAPRRKNDVGGSLSMTMKDFREKIDRELKAL